MPVYVMVLCLLSGSVLAEGFFLGGAADGMLEARRLELERRALEMDSDGGSRYDRLKQQHRLDDIQRLLEENNRLRRDAERRRMLNR